MLTAVIGKGGAGKTTATALLLRRLLDARQVPVLAVDADPSNCLGAALGLSIDRTIAHLRESMREAPDRPSTMSHAEWLALHSESALLERPGFDLLTMGHGEGPGCYCFVNSVIREYVDRLARTYRHVLIDCEAGLEHLSRRTTGRPDGLVCVVNRARMSAETIHRALELYSGLNGKLPPRVELVLNGFDEGEPLAAQMAEASSYGRDPFTRIFTVPLDPAIPALEAGGGSMLDLEAASPALTALEGWGADA